MERDCTSPTSGPIVVRVDPELMDLIPRFLEHERANLIALREALASQRFDVLERLGHQIKGDGAGYGFDSIALMGAALERSAREQAADRIRQTLDELTEYLAKLEVVEG